MLILIIKTFYFLSSRDKRNADVTVTNINDVNYWLINKSF